MTFHKRVTDDGVPIVVNYVPSQKTLLTLPVEERKRLVSSFRNNEAAILFIGWVEPSDRNTTSQAVNLVGFAAVAEITDVALLDTTGEIGIQLIGRCKVTEVVRVDNDGCQVKVVPHRDTQKPFENPTLTSMNIQALHSLYDRCNEAEALYRELQGKSDVAEVVRLRQPLHEKVDEILKKLEEPTEEEIAEWLSFCAMDYHIDPKARCWAAELQHTESRLALVRSALDEKLAKLKIDIRIMKAGV
ncbi:hypothetical protein IE077_004411 [Cardiosporidium cionae]|uniref:Lon N-terminal domain-containing protein n=1 Tax=Cardiosporidium cionae TaxID=476202 RepID=A0ABQ7JB68_9APIC|nr:hypothetical protein IE077_004411 [Cardiosporidium cionae]|eukprot:KAF8820900.1 hypothetical protein IE077_004411 [Cardiosporidium cionae]